VLLTKEQWLSAPPQVRFHAVDGSSGKGGWYSDAPFKDPTGLHYWRWHGHTSMPVFHQIFMNAFEAGFDWEMTLEKRPFETYPCPFCFKVEAFVDFDYFFHVRCHGCGAAGPSADTQAAAWELWGRRGVGGDLSPELTRPVGV